MIEQTRDKFRFIRNIHVIQTNDWKTVAKEEGKQLKDLELQERKDKEAHVNFIDDALMAVNLQIDKNLGTFHNKG